MPDLARYLFQSGHFSAAKARVKPGGFDPGGQPGLSVFDVRGATEDLRRDLGMRVAMLQGRPLKARAEIAMKALDDLPLAFERDDQPIERHGSVVGWPIGDSDDAKQRRLELATALASRATLRV